MRLTILTALLFICKLLSAQTIIWDGGGDGSTWEDPLNWDTDAIPCTTCDVIIRGADVSISSNQSIKSLSIRKDLSNITPSHLTQSGGFTLVISSAVTVGFQIHPDCEALMNGITNITGCNTGIYLDGLLNIAGTGTITESGSTFRAITNSGEIQVNGILTVNKNIENYDRIYIYGTLNAVGIPSFRNYFDGFSDGLIQVFSTGNLFIQNPPGTGLYNARTLVNQGQITITNSTGGHAIDNQNIGGTAVLQNFGTIDVTNSASGLYHGTANFTNETTGVINVTNGSKGIECPNLINKGEINISGLTGDSFLGGLTNSGFFHIDQSTNGMSLTQPLINQASGTIKCSNLTNGGISVFYHKLLNEGLIDLDTLGNEGIVLYELVDSLINKGQILINKTVGNGLRTWGNTIHTPVHNYSGAEIKVTNATGAGMGFDGTMKNEGLLEVQNVGGGGMGFSKAVINSDTIKIINGSQYGLSLSYFGTSNSFTNTASGFVQLHSLSDGLSVGDGIFINHGNIDIQELSVYGVVTNSDNFQNFGTIAIDDAGEYGISQGGILTNKSGGEINIINSDKGILNQKRIFNEGLIYINQINDIGFDNNGQSDTLKNLGTIRIVGTGGAGLRYDPFGVIDLFINESSGLIDVSQCSATGIILDGNTHENYGQILIDRCSIGLDDKTFNPGSGTRKFSNFGSVEISNSTLEGFKTVREFYNKPGGRLKILSSGSDAIVTKGLTNEECAWIITDGSIYTPVSIKNDVNDGFIIQDTQDTNRIYNAFENNGVFVDYNRFFPEIGFNAFVNNGHLIQPPAGFLSPGKREFYVVNKGSSAVYTLGNIWANKNHTLIAANANISDGSLLPTVDAPVADSLFFSFSAAGCTKDVPVNINNSPNCGGIYKNLLYTGSADSDWNNRMNYSPKLLPGPCSDVVSNPFLNLTVPTGTKARAHTLQFTPYSYPSAHFLAEPGSVFELDATN
ncbi:hypothetical protein [Jiulongibacter sediminis]|uniref:G8 domain-containing protein n=1 Tax=Jiulongibacter sediminis TaxID=1605367 RepID=A0A0P7BSI5_9BACT|nr:hypothetical protein [Jiulongibacter sediminis]KPM47414.1 hypothetical protein AFM12_14775 [Jiulongibacter sediminis]TBX22994.1 hypothetical protein TK44_14785 [Jiulongibacter sediminis]